MGLLPTWLGGTPTLTDQRADSIRSGTVAPTRSERQRCWEARDAYFACLDANNIVDALKEDKAAGKACGVESAGFERDCAREWVSSLGVYWGQVMGSGWLTTVVGDVF